MQRKFGKSSNWMQLYRENRISRALMDTSSASSLITDSAAASSAWAGAGFLIKGKAKFMTSGPDFELLKSQFSWLRATLAVPPDSVTQTW